jgi:hypothetical protein
MLCKSLGFLLLQNGPPPVQPPASGINLVLGLSVIVTDWVGRFLSQALALVEYPKNGG